MWTQQSDFTLYWNLKFLENHVLVENENMLIMTEDRCEIVSRLFRTTLFTFE